MEGTRESPGQVAMETDQLADRAETEPDVLYAGIARTRHQSPDDQRTAGRQAGQGTYRGSLMTWAHGCLLIGKCGP